MQVVAGNNPGYCAFLLNAFVNSNKQLQQKMNNNKMSFNDEVMQSIKKFVTSLSASGYRQKEEKEALRTILTACTYQLPTINKNKFCKAIEINKNNFNGTIVPTSTSSKEEQNNQPVYKHKV